MPFRQLDQRSILKTLEKLQLRISERFPESGLSRVGAELLAVGAEVSQTTEYLRRPNYRVRAAVWLVIAVMVAIASWMLARGMPVGIGDTAFIQVLESILNELVLLGIAIFFLLSVETRIKRKRALVILHELRSLAHVVDMHQLTKDPKRLTSGAVNTASSPERTMTADDLGRYLDYCSELLSVISKLAALLVQDFRDEIVLATVNEIETLSTGLSGKIWQKITLVKAP